MRRALKLLFLFCLCHLEVHVRAETETHPEPKYISVPEACWDTAMACAVSAQGAARLQQGRASLELSSGAMIRRNIAAAFNLLEGEVLVSTEKEALIFELPNGRLQVAPLTKLKLKRLPDGIGLEVLSGHAAMIPLGQKDSLNFPAGYKAMLEWVNAKGEVVINLPRSLSAGEWVALFHAFYRELPPSKLKAQLQQDFKVWRQAVETATEIQREYATRKIAEAAATEERIRRAKVREQRENRELRQMYLNKLYN